MSPRITIDSTSKILGVLSKYWFLFVGLIFLIPLVVKYYKAFVSTQAEKDLLAQEKLLKNANASPQTQIQILNTITTRSDVQSIAKNVAKHLGTDVLTKEAITDWFSGDSLSAWLSPSAWTENDNDAFLELLKVKQPQTVILVVNCYYIITRRDLKNDIKKYLPTDYIKKLPLFN